MLDWRGPLFHKRGPGEKSKDGEPVRDENIIGYTGQEWNPAVQMENVLSEGNKRTHLV
jgi:hypothetical protein